MRTTCWLAAICLALVGTLNSSHAQIIPSDSLYLGQTPPGRKPVIFKLPVAAGSFAAERIAISNDGREFYYQELDGYPELDGKPHVIRMKRLVYSNGTWNVPAVLFEGFFCPALIGSEDTLLFQKGVKEAYFSVRAGTGWSTPRRYLRGLKVAHYDQVTNTGARYISSVAPDGVGGVDRCRLIVRGNDTSVTSLGLPINTTGHDLDYFVSRDDSYMIVATDRGLCITYHKPDGSWTNPKNLGTAINFGLHAWGPYVTRDNKYMFYTTGTKPDYSDTYIYWVSLGDRIAGMKHTNFAPYVRTRPASQSAPVAKKFSYTLPDDVFVDDDGNDTLTFSAVLDDGQGLPSWLLFDPRTCTFSGMPAESGSWMVTVKATDNAGESVSCAFEIQVR